MAAATSLLANVSPSTRRLLDGWMQLADFDDGEDLVRQGDPADSAFFIEEGEVELTIRLPSGVVTPIARLKAGDVLGEFALMEEAWRSATATARGGVRARVVSRVDFQGLLGRASVESVELLHALAVSAARRVCAMTERLIALQSARVPAQGPIPSSTGTLPRPREGADFDIRPFLPRLPVFARFTAANLERFMQSVRVRSFRRGALLLDRDEKEGCVYVVVRGALEMRSARAVAASRIAVVGPGALLGVLPLLLERARTTACIAREDCVVLEISPARFRRLITSTEPHAFRFTRALVESLIERTALMNRAVARAEHEHLAGYDGSGERSREASPVRGVERR